MSDSTASLTYCPTVVNGLSAPIARRAQVLCDSSCAGSSHIASALTHQPAVRPVKAVASSGTRLIAPPVAQNETLQSPPAGTSVACVAESAITLLLRSATRPLFM